MSELLKIENVHMTYPTGTKALKGVSFTIEEGECVAIIGSSGSGKSTLMRCINQLVILTSGTISYHGQTLTGLSRRGMRKHRASIGMIFQHYNLVYRSSVIENVLHGLLGQMNVFRGFFGLYSQQDKERAKALLENIGLSEEINKRADELSGGQMQRVGICRALAQQPDLMLADEPIASLDPKATEDVMEALVTMTQQEHIACVMNLHQVDVARRYATRIIGIKKGELFFDGSPAELTDEIIHLLYDREEDTHD